MRGMITIETLSGTIERQRDIRDLHNGEPLAGNSADAQLDAKVEIVKIETPQGVVRRRRDVRDLPASFEIRGSATDPDTITEEHEAHRINDAIRKKEKELLATTEDNVPLSDCLALAVKSVLRQIEQPKTKTVELEDRRSFDITLRRDLDEAPAHVESVRLDMVRTAIATHGVGSPSFKGILRNLGIESVQPTAPRSSLRSQSKIAR